MKPSIPAVLGSMILGAALTLPVAESVSAATRAQLALASPVSAPRIERSLLAEKGPVDVVVQLAGQPLAIANGENAKRDGGRLSRAAQVSHSQSIRRSQDEVLAKVLALGGKEIARVRIAYNAAIVRIDASKLPQVASLPGVSAVKRVADYRLSLSETVPYIGASAVHAAGYTGQGVRVAVIDSGIDYTHRNFGGPGTDAAYEAAWGTAPTDARNTTRDGLFPTAKVVDGYDFVGEAWTGAAGTPPLAPDPDPIDFGTHGSHVGDIIGGKSADGTHVGVAPDVSLLAVKVCSALTTSCSGVAILQGIDFALDPNGDGSMDDAVDVMNLSLGSPFGQPEDSSAVAVTNAARAGVVVVTSSGNSGDRPYITGSPGMSPEVISVAQSEVPSAQAIPLVIEPPSPIAGTYPNTATLEWAPIVGTTTGTVAFVGRGCNVDTYSADPAGKIALVERGSCNISEKVRRASDAGAIGVIVGLVAAGDAVSFSNGGHCPEPPDGTCKPSIVIQQSLSQSIQGQPADSVTATLSADNGIPLVGSVVSTSSRGPSSSFNQIKPDIAAPGGSISAEAGTGTGETPFSGTSGAAPMVAGAAALLLEAYPNRAPWAIKSVLMNTADNNIYTNPAVAPGVLAPVTRIGGGEVRVDDALASTTAAWDAERRAGSLSFGYLNVSDTKTLVRKVKVQNYGNKARRYSISNGFRFANDAASGAVRITTPSSINVPARGTATFDVVMKIDAKKLPVWVLNGGPDGGTGSLLQTAEYDGYLTLKDSKDTVRLAWQVLPHKSADLHAVNRNVIIPGKAFGLLALANLSPSLPAAFDIFDLTGTSGKLPKSAYPAPGEELTVHDLKAVGVRALPGGILQFGVSLYGRASHPVYPRGVEIDIDTNGDGEADWFVYNVENGTFGSTGQTLVAVENANSEEDPEAFFYADADLNSGNIILTLPMAAVGLAPGSKFSFDAVAYDNYFTGAISDTIAGSVYTIGTPKYVVTSDVALPEDGVPPRSGLLLKVDDVAGGAAASPSQTGFLLMYRDAAEEAETVTVYQIGKK